MVCSYDGPMKTSRAGRIALAASEGFVNTAYLDSKRIWTLGIGHTASAGPPDPKAFIGKIMTPEEVMELFATDLPKYEDIVNRWVVVPLKQHEFDALVHFVYNIGEPNFRRSKLLRNLNNGDFQTAGQYGFHGWLKPPELRKRRDKERAMFMNADYGSSTALTYTADTAGKKRLTGTVDLSKLSDI